MRSPGTAQKEKQENHFFFCEVKRSAPDAPFPCGDETLLIRISQTLMLIHCNRHSAAL
jgi:hypothetical protein